MQRGEGTYSHKCGLYPFYTAITKTLPIKTTPITGKGVLSVVYVGTVAPILPTLTGSLVLLVLLVHSQPVNVCAYLAAHFSKEVL